MDKHLEDALCLTEADCLLIDPRASQERLFDQAERRLDAVKDLMFTLTMLDGRSGSLEATDIANLAGVSQILLGDAGDLLAAARRLMATPPSHSVGGGHV